MNDVSLRDDADCRLRQLETESAPDCATILLVEDEKLVREVAAEILRSAGYFVLQAPCGAEARRIFRQHEEDVDLLLTDVVLPDEDGSDLARDLCGIRPTLKTIFISGYPENAVTRAGLQEHEPQYLPKPFSSESLIKKIKEVLAEAESIESEAGFTRVRDGG